MSVNFKVRESALAQLEEDLNQVLLDGIPVGGLLAGTLLIELMNGNRTWDKKQRLSDHLASINLKYRKNRGYFQSKGDEVSLKEMGQGKGLLSFISDRPHLLGINKTLWDNSRSPLVGFMFKSAIRDFFQAEEQSSLIDGKQLLAPNHEEWRSVYKEIRPELKEKFRAFVKANKLPAHVALRLNNKLMEQTQALLAFRQTLGVLRPKYVLVECDRYSLTSPLVLAANALNIPTYTMMHGSVNSRFGYLPLIANNLFCWGHRQKRLLQNHGALQGQIVVTGAPQLSSELKGNPAALKQKLNCSNQQVFLLGTNPITPNLREALVQMFCEGITDNKAFKGIIRLHPSENKAQYQNLIQAFPDVIFDDGSLLNFDESLAVADAICVYNSAFGLDAMLKSKPLLVLNVDSDSLGQGKDFIDFGRIPELVNAEQFKLFLSQWEEDPLFVKQVLKKSVMYIKTYCEDLGSKAALRTLNHIEASK